jgi:hypothetical protein
MATGMFYTDQGIIDISAPASGDLSASQFLAVTLDGNNEVAVAGANAKALGILQNKPSAQGETARVRIQGVSKAIVSEPVTLMQKLTSTAAGKLEVTDAAGEELVARALGAYTTDDQAEVQLMFGKSQASDV